jgi:hypothetical protein
LQNAHKTDVDKFQGEVKKLQTLNSQLSDDKTKILNKLEKITELNDLLLKEKEDLKLSHSQLSQIYKNITGKDIDFNSSSEIIID